MRIFCLSSVDATTDTIWGDVREHFERFAALRGEATPEQVRQAAIDSSAQIWGLQDAEEVHAVVVTEIKATAKGNRCDIWIAHGSAPVSIQERLLDEIGAWARQLGCYTVRVMGRKGWKRRFPRFREVGVILEWSL